MQSDLQLKTQVLLSDFLVFKISQKSKYLNGNSQYLYMNYCTRLWRGIIKSYYHQLEMMTLEYIRGFVK